jgi:hypothetical protein
VPCLILLEHVASGWHFSPTFSAITLATRMNQCLISDLFGVCNFLAVKNAAVKLHLLVLRTVRGCEHLSKAFVILS